MLQFMINSFILTLSFIFFSMNHPLTMGLIILIQTLFISLLIGLMSKTFWFSYILFLVFLGGMLVMFIYVTSLSYNEMFFFSKKLPLFIIFMIMIMFISYFIIDMNYIYSMMNFEMSNFFNFSMYMNEDSMNLNKLYNFSTNLITLFLINYLFLTLIICVKITNFFYGPLRPSF